jgi:DNA-binding transcriptional ArsR family regulator
MGIALVLCIGLLRGDSSPPMSPSGAAASHRDGSAAAEPSPFADERPTGYRREMSTIAGMAEIAALVGDPARTSMLTALMQGRALTAKELALTAGIAAPTASGHLGRLAAAGLVAVTAQGRHRYYRLGSPRVAALLESLTVVAALSLPARPRARSPQDEALRRARTCYDHLAGRLGVAIAGAMVERGHIVLAEDGGEVTDRGAAFLADRLGLDIAEVRSRRRVFCRPCLDWSERVPHLAGALGAALADRCFDLGWVQRRQGTRALAVTDAGAAALEDVLGVSI